MGKQYECEKEIFNVSNDFDYYIEDHKLLEVTKQADLGIIISND